VLKWLQLGHSPAKIFTPYCELVAGLIAKGHTHCCELLGHEPSNIVVSVLKNQQHLLWQFSDLWQSALANFPGHIREHLPHSKLLVFLPSCICFSKNFLPSPLSEAVKIFSDASGHGTAACYTKDFHKVEHTVFASTKRVELYAPINLYSDSHCVVIVLRCIETAYIGHTSSEELLNLFFQLCSMVQTRLYPCFVSHCTHILISLACLLMVMLGQIT
jgi:hypothetical protein